MSGLARNFFHVIKTDGTLWSAGLGTSGRLGVGDTTTRTSLTQVGSGTDWLSVSCGGFFAAAIKTDGTLWAWGDNLYGQLGQGDYVNSSSPKQVGTGATWARVSCGYTHLLALKTDGTLWACGQGFVGALGQGSGDTSDHNTLVQIGVGAEWSWIAAGVYTNLAIKTDGTLWGWGNNAEGMLGLGDTTARYEPTQVGAGTTWEFVCAAKENAMAIKADGTLWATGGNSDDKFTAAYPSTSSVFVQVGTDADWAAAAVNETGSGVSIALKTDGTLWACGSNGFYRMGVGESSAYTASSYEQIGTGSGWRQLGMGRYGVYALDSSGDLYGWGENGSGNLGLGDTTYRDVPTQITTSAESLFDDVGGLIDPPSFLTELPVAVTSPPPAVAAEVVLLLTELPMAVTAPLPAVAAEVVSLWQCTTIPPVVSGVIAQGRLIDIALTCALPSMAGTSQSATPTDDGSFQIAVSAATPEVGSNIIGGSAFVVNIVPGVPLLETEIEAGMSVSLRAYAPTLLASMYREIEWSISLQAPSPSQAAEFYADLSTTFDTWAVNASNAGHSAYTGYAFTSFFFFQGDYYGVASDGIYKLEGSDDAGEAIQPVAMFGVSNLGADKVKRLDSVYPEVISDAAGAISVTVSVDGSAEQTFSGSVQEAVTAPVRCKISRGLSGRYWQIGVGCTTDGKLEITSLRAVTVPLSRRV